MSQPIHKVIRVQCSVEHAFAVYTQQTDMWWPPGHRVIGEKAAILLEPGEGGRFYARGADGATRTFGEVLSWQPPNRLVYSWFLGTSEALPTEVEIQFIEDGEHTRVEVTHREAAALEGEWPHKASGFSRAWDHVLPAFVAHLQQGEI